MVERRIGNKTVRLVRGDITELEVEAFVHDITADMKLGSGFGGAIQMRGGIAIQKELQEIGSCPPGTAVVTGAGLLKANHIIHVNGPKFHESDTEGTLRNAARSALDRAEERGVATLAFPAIGAGLYQVPLDLCARVLVETVAEHLKSPGTTLKEVLFVANDTREVGPFKAQLEGAN